MITLYGIKNCDTMKKAMRWLDEHGVDYRFHDYRKDGLDPKQLRAWEKELGWERLLNRRGLLWRKLPQEVRDHIDRKTALQLMQDNPGIIKRPLADLGDRRVLGFNADDYEKLFP
ncbi:MAG TPA: ArsC family reductase [Gammaproteobacteria bacterium]|nr:ArsC family reductase [Gammaproteobacteria bacterium]